MVSTGRLSLADARRPGKSPFFQAFCTNPKPRPIKEKDLEPVAALIAEDKEMTRERVGFERTGNQGGEAIKTLAHNGGSGYQKDARGGAEV